MSSHPQPRDQHTERCIGERNDDWLARFSTYLEQRGHRPGTAQAYHKALEHFLHWWKRLPRAPDAPLSAALVQTFLDEHLPACTCPGRVVHCRATLRAALNQFLLMHGQPRLIQSRPVPVTAAIAEAVCDFDHYLETVCALAAQTRRARCRLVTEFLIQVFGQGTIALERLTPSLLLETVTTWAAHTTPSMATVLVSALRSYLRFLCFQGSLHEDLSSVLPAPAGWRLSRVPPALSAAELTQLWAAFDLATPIGQRDYAMARCLADLGLRCREVATLTLEAMDWRRGVLTLSQSKTHRCDELPLPSSTGEALVAYLRHGRPRCRTRALFVHHRAPWGAPVATTTVAHALRRAFQRAGLPGSGPHILSHTAARRMLQGGCSLKEIADVLRHRNLDTTAIYAKVDLPHLAQVALPWPEVRP
jgi:site-specific recombinase XerD